MTTTGAARRAKSEVRWDANPAAITWVGSRPLYQYWPVLASYFREVLLPPQRRAEERRVTWAWREPATVQPPSAAELATLRQRLTGEQQLLVENVARGPSREDEAGGLRSSANLTQLSLVMARVVADLVERGDAELAACVCRTDAGWRVHGWGASSAARVVYPDERAAVEVSGRVLVDGQPAVWRDVFLTEEEGGSVSRMRTDDTGAFRFPAVAEGQYRLQAQAGRMRFPAEGLLVAVGAEPVTDLLLQHPETGGAAALGKVARYRGRWLAAIASVAALILAGIWWARRSSAVPFSIGAEEAAASKTVKVKPSEASSDDLPRRDASPAARPNDSRAAPTGGTGSVVGGSGFGGGTSPRGAKDVTWDARGLPVADTWVEPPLVGGGGGGASGTSATDATGAGGSVGGGTSGEITGGSSGGGKDGGIPEKQSNGQPSAISGTAARPAPPGAGTKQTAPARPPSGSAPAAAPPGSGTSPKQEPARKIETLQPKIGGLAVMRLTDETRTPAGKPSPEPEAVVAPVVVNMRTEAVPVALLSDARPDDRADPLREAQVGAAAASDTTHPGDAATPPTLASSFAAREPNIQAVSPRLVLPPPQSFGRTVRARFSPWQHRMLADRIVPTEPLPVGKTGSVQALRDRLRVAQDATLPSGFRTPRFEGGIVLDLSSLSPGLSARLRWRDASGLTPAGVSLAEGRAEVRWTGATPRPGVIYFLGGEKEAPLARLTVVAATGEWTLETTEGVRAHPWLALCHEAPSGRFSWRTGTGAPLGAAWTETAASDAASRVEVSLAALTTGSLSQTLAVLDRETGWALVGGMEFSIERPFPRETAR